MTRAEFDAFADSYDRDLDRGLSLTGEGKAYYARGRLVAVRRALDGLGVDPARVLDYGCGTGTAAPLLREVLGARQVVGVDPSAASIERARAEHGDDGLRFVTLADFRGEAAFDLVFVNGVFHHIPPADRAAALQVVSAAIRPGGVLALWENNPFNFGTRWVMRRVAFDRDAVMLSPGEVRRLVAAAGLSLHRTSFHFVFPKMLSWFRGLESAVSGLPLGGQYLVLAPKPLR